MLGALGAVGGGLLADRMLRGGDKDAYVKMAIIAGLGVLPFSVLAPLAPSAYLSLALFGGAILFNSTWLSVCGGSIQLVAPNQMRGQATALMFLFSSMIGFGLGPTAIALITDQRVRRRSGDQVFPGHRRRRGHAGRPGDILDRAARPSPPR